MKKEILYEKLIPKDRNLKEIVLKVKETPEMIAYLLEGTEHKTVRIKFGCSNTLVLISERYPKLLYPYFGQFVEYLNSENSIIKLSGIKIISHLSKVDEKKKFDLIFDKFYSFITDWTMTPAAEVSKGSSIIFKAKPYLAENISTELLRVPRSEYKSDVCKNILIGHVITSLDSIFAHLEDKERVLDFVESNRTNTWKATKKRAQKFLKKYNAPSLNSQFRA